MSGLTREPRNRKHHFANSSSVGTEAINIEQASFGGVFADASFDGTALTWECAYTAGYRPAADVEADSANFTWYDANDATGNPLATTISAGDYAPLPPELFGARYIRATSDTTQTGDGFVTIILKG